MKIMYLEGKFIVKTENVIKGRRIVKFWKLQNVKRENGSQSIYLLQFLEFYTKPQNYTVSSKSVGTVKRIQFCKAMYNCGRLVASQDP